ncbi:hypothetical protein GP486_004235 [Trichoglossum hirsutum]|uniref:Uncharacterized protein n=1 Tax=Trichoglossum hirsutum TaxID=265104 RepID=A0A9P8LBJ6_9PEZI|nr:hypothetical protein GP486_004235 [Trichoglossum hirsutum]
MSFGYSISDFLAVVQLAFKVYEKCKNSSSEFRALASDIGNAHFVLCKVHDFWAYEKSRDQDLLTPQQEELKPTAENLEAALKEVENIYGKHNDLSTSDSFVTKFKSRSKYVFRDLVHNFGLARQKLQITQLGNSGDSHYRATNEATVEVKDALKAFKDQAEILQALTKKVVEAAKEDLLAENIDRDVIDKNQEVAKEWLEAVILVDQDENEADGKTIVEEPEDSPGLAGKEDTEGIMTTLIAPALVKCCPFLDTEGFSGSKADSNDVDVKRSASISTHRSHSSSWQSGDAASTHDYAAMMIAKVLRSKYPPSAGDDIFQLPLKRAFHQLDWTNRGWLPRVQVEDQCLAAAQRLHQILDRHSLATIVKAEDEKDGTPNHHIDISEFCNIVLKVRKDLFRTIESDSIKKGLRHAVRTLAAWHTSQPNKLISPFWNLLPPRDLSVGRLPSTFLSNVNPELPCAKGTGFYCHDLAGDFPPDIYPLERSMTNAIYLATDYCIKQVNSALHGWQKFLKPWSVEENSEVLDALDAIVEIASKFHYFESEKGITTYHWVDDLLDNAHLVPIAASTDLQEAPFSVSTQLRDDLWLVLERILGLVIDLGTCTNTNINQFMYHSPVLSKWRQLGMLDRAKNLSAVNARVWTEAMTKDFREIKSWYQQHSELHEIRMKCVDTAKELRDQQQNIYESLQQKWVNIDNLRAEGLPKVNFRRPTTYCVIFVDGTEVGRTLPEKSCNPCPVKRSSRMKITLFSESQVGQLGHVEFLVKDNVDFARRADVAIKKDLQIKGKPTRIRLTLSPSRGEIDRLKVRESPLSSFILTNPLSDGWVVRRCEVKDCYVDGVYFYHEATSRATAPLWLDPFYLAAKDDLKPLSKNWKRVLKDGKVFFQKRVDGTLTSSPPKASGGDTFDGVIRPVSYYVPSAWGL